MWEGENPKNLGYSIAYTIRLVATIDLSVSTVS